MNEAFLRTQMLLGADALDKLSRCHVIVFGLGGVGSYAAECLARSGVGELTLVDQDTLSLTNINRQLYALHSTVGQYKAEAAACRCLDINPDLRVHPVCATYDAAHRDDFFTAHYDYIVDAIDLVSCKLDLIEQARLRRIPILTALGTGNKLDPTLLQVTDISKTSGCPLARVMRKELRARDIHHLKVVFSPEQPAETQQLEALRPRQCGVGTGHRRTADGQRCDPRPDRRYGYDPVSCTASYTAKSIALHRSAMLLFISRRADR